MPLMLPPELLDVLDRHFRKASTTLAAAEQLHRLATERGADAILPITNAQVFITLAHMDLVVLLWELREYQAATDAAGRWRRRLHARTLVLLLHSVGERLPTVLGGDFRRAVGAIDARDTLPALNAVHGQVTAFVAEHGGELKALRNFVVAHRDLDATAQLTALAFDVDQVQQLGEEFFKAILPLYAYLTDLNRRITMIAQAARAAEQPDGHPDGQPDGHPEA